MLDNQQSLASGGQAESQALLLQAIWSLEEASEAHAKLLKISRESTWSSRDVARDAALINRNIKKSLSSLSLLHRGLFGRHTLDSIPASYVSSTQTLIKRRDLRLALPKGGPRRDPKFAQLQSLLQHFTENPVILTMNCTTEINPKRDCTLVIDMNDIETFESGRALTEKDGPCMEVSELVEEVEDGSEVLPLIGQEPHSEALVRRVCVKEMGLSISLKQVRRYFERKYEDRPTGIPLFLVELLDSFEKQFSVRRHPTTDSIWNIDHQQQRELVFDETNIGIVFRDKCLCDPRLATCSRDAHCPLNIPLIEAEFEWDKNGKEWAKKNTSEEKVEEETEEEEEVGEETEEEEVEAVKEKKKKKKKEKLDTAETKMEKALTSITEMVGLDKAKSHVQKLKAMIETAKRQGVNLQQERFGTVIMGNSGTGKTSFAREYVKYLCASGVVKGDHLIEATGIEIASGGPAGVETHMGTFDSNGGGVFFIDDVQFMSDKAHQWGGYMAWDFIRGEVERRIGQVIYVLAGSGKNMTKLLGRGGGNAGSLLPYMLTFPDFSDEELLSLLVSYIKKKFDGKMNVEGGLDGVYLRVAARRLGRNRGKAHFDNARAVENLFAQIWERQSTRRELSRKKKAEEKKADENLNGAAKKESKAKESAQITGDNTGQETKTPENEQGLEEKKSEELTEEKDAKVDSVVEISNKDDAPAENETKTPVEEGKPAVEEDSTDSEDYIFTKEDILGSIPSDAILESPAWKKLQRLTGLKAVKDSILNILQLSKTNYQRELEEKPLLELSFNRLFLGPPGTGKTVVAKLYGQILAEMGVLSKGEMLVRTPSDLIGKYIGHSEANTKAILAAAAGNVLVIDEAYMMYGGGGRGGGSADIFREAIIDTLVSEIQNVPGEDRCVLLLGYADQMQEMLQNCNPGLSRRFPLADAFWFHAFTTEELENILRTKLEDNGLQASEHAIKVAMDVLEKARSRLNFGNGGEVENIITRAKTNYQSRLSQIKIDQRPEIWTLEPQDFDPEFDRGKGATSNLHRLFSDVIGCEAIITKLEQYQRVSQAMKLKNMDPKNFIPTNFVFKGPPGTGKTTTARKIAQVYYDMGFLSEPSVIECSASDLIGKYVGHSGPQTVKILERGLGKVLFIDEAYRLAGNSCSSSNTFTSEVVSELVDSLTKPKFFGRIIVILAGYENEMNHLLSINPGLASRFPEEIHFPAMMPGHALTMLKMKLGAAGIEVPVLDQEKGKEYRNLWRLMGQLSGTPSWGNGRDVETLAKSLTRLVFAGIGKVEDELVCTAEMVTATMEALLVERRARTVRD